MKSSHYKNNTNKPQVLPIGLKIFIHATPPGDRSKNLYLCEARVIRQPKRRDDERYKIIITGVLTYSDQRLPKLLLGMKIVRPLRSITRDEPWKYSSNGTWLRVPEDQVPVLVHRSVNNIRKSILQRKRCNVIQQLD